LQRKEVKAATDPNKESQQREIKATTDPDKESKLKESEAAIPQEEAQQQQNFLPKDFKATEMPQRSRSPATREDVPTVPANRDEGEIPHVEAWEANTQLDPIMAQVLEDALKQLESLGAILVEIDLFQTQLAIPAYYIIAPAEASTNLSRFDGVRYGYRCEDPKDLQDLYRRSRSEGFGTEVQQRILVGTYSLSSGYYDAYYGKAQRARRLIAEDYAEAFKQVDLIASPVTPGAAFELGSKTTDPVAMYLEDIYTLAVNLAGLPALSMPAGFYDHRPLGLQLIGNHFTESTLLSTAHQFQQATDWHTRKPPLHAEIAR